MKRRTLYKQKGFSLFLAIIVMGVLLIIGFSVANIGSKEVNFSTISRESQYAIFAADAGVECALYWDTKHPSGNSAFATSSSGSPIICVGSNIVNGAAISGTSTLALIGGGGDANATSTFGFVMSNGSNPVNACVIVTVNKRYDGPAHNGPLITSIYSRGYNNCNTTDFRRVERGIEVRY